MTERKIVPTISIPPDVEQYLKDAWEAPYKGDCDEVWYESLCEMYRKSWEEGYAKHVVVCQSSGYGKSRTLSEMMNRVFTIPINIRHWQDTFYGAAWPLPDLALGALFRDIPTLESLYDDSNPTAFEDRTTRTVVEEHYRELLKVTFDRVLAEVKKVPVEAGKTLPQRWKSYLEGQDPSCQQGISRQARLFDDIAEAFEPCITKRTGDCLLSKQELVEYLKENMGMSGEGQLVLLFAIDEAHELARPPSILNQEVSQRYGTTEQPEIWLTRLDILLGVIESYRFTSVFFALLSTQLDLGFLASSDTGVPSLRYLSHFKAHAPITEAPFDCYGGLKLSRLQLHMLHDPMYMCLYGRPLWATLCRKYIEPVVAYLTSYDQVHMDAFGTDDAKDRQVHQLMTTIRIKLLSTMNLAKCMNYTQTSLRSDNACIALVACRLHLAFDHSQTVLSQKKREWVRTHLATLFAVDQTGTSMLVGWPSEPIVAEAAAWQMHIWTESAFAEEVTWEPDAHPMIATIGLALDNDLLDLEEVGEAVARVLLLCAHDDAVRAQFEKAKSSGTNDDSSATYGQWTPNFSTPVGVVDYVESLFAGSTATLLLNSMPEGANNHPLFREQFANSVVNFTHFSPWGPFSELDSAGLMMCFARHTAIITAHRARGVDLIIPILLDKDSESPIRPSNISAIFIQVKRNLDLSGLAMDQLAVDKLCEGGFWGKCGEGVDSNRARPYIAIVMDLGVDYKAATPVQHVTVSTHNTRRQACHDVKYGISVYGCTRSAYKAIPNWRSESLLDKILSKDSLYAIHPRKDQPTALIMLAQQLPLLEKDALVRMANDEDMGTDEGGCGQLSKKNLDAPQKIYPRLDPRGKPYCSLSALMTAEQMERHSEQADAENGSNAADKASTSKKRKR